jgi:hypothetical protein
MSELAEVFLQQVEAFMDEWTSHLRVWNDDDIWFNFAVKVKDMYHQVRPHHWASVPHNELYHFIRSHKKALDDFEGSDAIATFIHTFHGNLVKLCQTLKQYECSKRG